MKTTKIRYYAWYFLGMALFAASLHALSGDINGDGVLDVADVVRVQGMIDATVSADSRADFNFDGTVNAVDLRMLEDALRGVALPALLAKATIGAAGGTLEHAASGFRLELPAGALATAQSLALAEWDRGETARYGMASVGAAPLMLYGLPAVAEAEISFALPAGATRNGESYSLAVGVYELARNSLEPRWHFQLMTAEDGVSVSNGRLTWRPELIPQSGGLRRSDARPGGIAFEIVRDWLGGTTYQSTNFRLQPVSTETTNAEMDRLQGLLQDLEYAYTRAVALGFPMSNRTTLWGDDAQRVKIVIKKPDRERLYGLIGSNEGAEDAWCLPPGYFSAPYLELNTGVVTSASRREIVAHEFVHYVQYMYANNTTTMWLDEMSATWMEGHVSPQGRNYTPSTYKNPRAPINGLYRRSSRFNVNYTGFHGYSLSVFAAYLSQQGNFPADFWHRVFNHDMYKYGEGVAPFAAAAGDMGVLGLETMYQRFLRDYLSGKSPYSTSMYRSITIFGNTDQNEGDWQRFAQNGKVSKITKPADISGKLEQAFSIQDMGAATWLFTFPKPKELVRDGDYARLEVDDVCSDLFAVLFQGPEAIGVSSFENIKRDDERKKLILDISLNALKDSDRPMSIGVVAVNANDNTGDAPELRPVTLSMQFLGVVTLPVSTTHAGVFDMRLMQASADLEIRSETLGVLGLYTVDMWPGVGEELGPFPVVTVQMNKVFPQTLRVRSTISLVDFGEVHGKDNLGYDFSSHMVPTQRVKILVGERTAAGEELLLLDTVETTLDVLASKDGVPVELSPNNIGNSVAIELIPIYEGTGITSSMGENLRVAWCEFFPYEGAE